jgi:hypothetical protein
MANYLFTAGTIIAVQDGAAWHNLCTTTGISGPNRTKSLEDVTTLCDTAEAFATSPIQSNGTISLDMNYAFGNDGIDRLEELFDANPNVAGTYRITFPTTPAEVWTFNAVITSFPISGQVKGKFTSNVELQITGAITKS